MRSDSSLGWERGKLTGCQQKAMATIGQYRHERNQDYDLDEIFSSESLKGLIWKVLIPRWHTVTWSHFFILQD
jgi:hypothetical protein